MALRAFEHRDQVIAEALSLAMWNLQLNPADPHRDASGEYHEDEMRHAAFRWIVAHQAEKAKRGDANLDQEFVSLIAKTDITISAVELMGMLYMAAGVASGAAVACVNEGTNDQVRHKTVTNAVNNAISEEREWLEAHAVEEESA